MSAAVGDVEPNRLHPPPRQGDAEIASAFPIVQNRDANDVVPLALLLDACKKGRLLRPGLVGNAGKARMDATPLGRYAKPSDIAYGCLYLASDEAAWMTGSELVIDGGMTAN